MVTAYVLGSKLAAQLGFSFREIFTIALVIAEVARNIVRHAGHGEVTISETTRAEQHGLVISAQDCGPGIPDIDLAMQAGYSTKRGLGMGLPLVTKRMDEFEIVSVVGQGTTVTLTKWLGQKPAKEH